MRGVAIALLLVTLAAGCGGDVTGGPRVDAGQVELLLIQRQKERSPALRFDKAACPDGVSARQGESFDCSVQVEGEPARIRVTVAEVLGGRARYEFRPAQAIVDLTGVTNFVRNRLGDEWRTAKVDCGPGRARVLDVGQVIECTAFDGTSTRYIQAVVEDLDGTVTLRER